MVSPFPRFELDLYDDLSSESEEEEEEEEVEVEEEEEEEDSFEPSSLSMSIDSHLSLNSSPINDVPERGNEETPRERKLSVSLFYEEEDAHAFESNPLSYPDNVEDEDKDFQKLSFTRTRKMSDAGGW